MSFLVIAMLSGHVGAFLLVLFSALSAKFFTSIYMLQSGGTDFGLFWCYYPGGGSYNSACFSSIDGNLAERLGTTHYSLSAPRAFCILGKFNFLFFFLVATG
jgi:hypothetical protein